MSRMLAVASVLLIITLTTTPTVAANPSGNYLLDGLQSCSTPFLDEFQTHTQNFRLTTVCMADRAISDALNFTQNFLTKKGRTTFGEGFRIASSLNYSVSNRDSIQGSLDAVIPLYSFVHADATSPVRSSFLQQGITRWIDDRGIQRSDVRVGAVYRFTSNRQASNVFGVSTLIQQNLELEHKRLAIGLDYAGVSGSGSLTYFKPVSGWKPNRFGYEERPLEGMDLDLQLKPTATILLKVAVGRWRDQLGSGHWLTRGRAGFEWRPHPYLRLGVEGRDFGTKRYNGEIRLSIQIPLNAKQKWRGRWQGLGRNLKRSTGHLDVWRPVDNVRRLEYEERKLSKAQLKAQFSATLIAGSNVRFMQSSAISGTSFKLEVSIATPAPEDALLTLEFSPGDGDNPAVAGEDYEDKPVEVLIKKGKTKAIVTIELPLSPEISTKRALRVTVTSASLQMES